MGVFDSILRRRRRLLTVGAVAIVAVGAGVVVAATKKTGRIGPGSRIQPSGRQLDPVGRLTRLGNLPTGGALTVDGRFAWTLSAGRGRNDIRIVRVLSRRRRLVGRVVQNIQMPGLSGGIAMAPDGRTAYVSGTPEGDNNSNSVGDDVPGQFGDVIHVFSLDPSTGRAERDGVIDVSPPDGTPPPQNFPPTDTDPRSWPRDLAVSPDGGTLLAALNLANQAAIIDTDSRTVEFTPTGRYPYGAAITRDGKLGLVSNETDGTVTVLDLTTGAEVKEITVGPHLSHPEGIAIDPKRPLAYVAVTHQDVIAVIDLAKLEVARTLSVGRPKGIGTAPVHLSVTRDGCRLLSADSGEDAIAVFALSGARRCDPGRRRRAQSRRAALANRILDHESRPGIEQSESEKAEQAELFGEEAEEGAEEAVARNPVRRRSRRWQLIGRIPVASYPTVALATPALRPRRRKLVWITAKGVGVGPNDIPPGTELPEDGPRADANDPTDQAGYHYYYLPEQVKGISGIMPFPSDRRLRRLTPRAAKQLRPINAQRPPEKTPIRRLGPIEHVFYIVRENRTYDQILGDDPRGDGDPKLAVFGKDITPNVHALARRFPLLDHVYANSEASIDGHFWTSAAAVSDYVVKNWHANYAGRGRPYDFGVYSVTWPAAGFLFDQAQRQGIPWFNYGEAIAGVVPLNDIDRTPAETAQVAAKFAKSDLGPLAPGPQPSPPAPCFTNDAGTGTNVINGQDVWDSSLPPGADPSTSESRYQCFEQRFQQQVTAGNVPAFNYLTYANDHTEGTSPGRRTPNAMVAANDLAVGETVDLISHSPIWKKSLILVIEDDSQDGADHVDAHRIPALAISPYARRGAVVHNRYDFLSFIRTLELVVGMKPLNLFDATAVPLYNAFDAKSADNDHPYDAIVPSVDLTETNSASATNASLSEDLPLEYTDRVPQSLLDRILWQSKHGAGSEPPPPGPNASGVDEAAWLREKISDEEALEEVIELLGLDEKLIEERYDPD